MKLIDKDALEVVTAKVPKGMDAKSYMAGMEYVLSQIDALPTIEERKTGRAVYQAGYAEGYKSAQLERKTGEWIDYAEDGYVECPFCHSATNCDGNIEELHFCFSCGAMME